MRRAALAFLPLWFAAGSVLAQPEAPAPYHLVRALQYGQDELVRGGGTPADQGKLLASIAGAFEQTPAEAWRDPKNAAAAAVFLFSGGAASAVRNALAAGAFAGEDTALVRGAVAFADGREGEARALLLPIPPENVSPSVAGHLALVQATLIGRNDPPKVMEKLGLAGLLAPGTIVEETALRRQIFWAADVRNFSRLLILAEQYLWRFPGSAYARAFQTQLIETVLDAALACDPDSLDGLDSVFQALPLPERRAMMLNLARGAILRGKVRLARLAAEMATRYADARSPEAARADLYWAAANIASDAYAAALARAESLTPASLDPADRELLRAVLALARTLRAWPSPGGDVAPRAEPELPPSLRATLNQASAVLADTDRALKRERR